MRSKKKKLIRVKGGKRIHSVFVGALVLISISGFGIYHLVIAQTNEDPIIMDIDPNIGLEAMVVDFFTTNNAPEMIPIIKCESEFKHYKADGTILQNREGSSAIGIAQILSSAHPDPKVLSLFNKRHNADVQASDIDITTVEGNLGYALMLYELRGTRDWACSKKFRFR
ncbi:MAG: hypothetical protein ACI9VM_000592 [Candidatus Azotimanducaceae bacterium]|jgi:hypothetical protein